MGVDISAFLRFLSISLTREKSCCLGTCEQNRRGYSHKLSSLVECPRRKLTFTLTLKLTRKPVFKSCVAGSNVDFSLIITTMATALAAQLAQIAANAKSTLDVKAQKAAHSKSLIFEPRVAAVQNFQTLYGICREGFDELCQLEPRFVPFGTTLFSEQSRDEDRTQMTAAENAELNKRIDSFLHLAGARLRLMPAIKAIEWLIRRFR